jgi:hypothetical protein
VNLLQFGAGGMRPLGRGPAREPEKSPARLAIRAGPGGVRGMQIATRWTLSSRLE